MDDKVIVLIIGDIVSLVSSIITFCVTCFIERIGKANIFYKFIVQGRSNRLTCDVEGIRADKLLLKFPVVFEF